MKVLIGAFALALLAGAPVGLAMLFAGGIGALTFGGPDLLSLIPEKIFSGVSPFLLIAIPYFIFTTELMNHAGLTERLLAFNQALFGRIRGGLSHVNITTSVFFAGLTGAAVTDTVSIGRLIIPAMKREGYSASYAAAVTGCSSIVGPIVPPSIVMVMYSTILRDVSVVQLFAAGIFPGLLMALSMLIASGFLAWYYKLPKHTPAPLSEAVRSFFVAIPALIVPFVILFGILFGITTVTEASALAAMYTVFIGLIFYRNLNWEKIKDALFTTARFSGVVFFLVAASTVLSWFVVRSGVAREAATFIEAVSDVAAIQILLIVVVLIIIGTIVDVLPALVITGPIFHPAMVALGFDPVHFAMVMIVALNIANITPPVGMSLMTAAQIAKVPYERAIVSALPFFLAIFICLLVIVFVPGISLVFPEWIDS